MLLEKEKETSRFLPWFYWGTAAFFFFVEYFVRVSPSVMTHDLMRDLNVTAVSLGSLSACFYYAYVGMQVPVGALIDRYGPRALLTVATMLCGLSSLWFGQAEDVFAASVARFILGFGSAFAFVGALKLATNWLPTKYWGIVVGITQGLGMLGACVGEAPMALTVDALGWRETMEWIGILFIVLAITIALLVRDEPEKTSGRQHSNASTPPIGMWRALKIALSNSQTWVNATFAGLLFAPTAVFGELWGVSYLNVAGHMSVAQAATAVGLIFIGWTLGGPFVGWLSDRLQKRRPVMMMSSLSGLVLLPALIAFTTAPFWIVASLLTLYGFLNSGLVASYALSTEINPKGVSGIALGFTNMASVIIGAALQPVVGLVLDWHWSGQTTTSGVPIYDPEAFVTAMMVLPVCAFLAFMLTFFIKETHCQPLESRS